MGGGKAAGTALPHRRRDKRHSIRGGVRPIFGSQVLLEGDRGAALYSTACCRKKGLARFTINGRRRSNRVLSQMNIRRA